MKERLTIKKSYRLTPKEAAKLAIKSVKTDESKLVRKALQDADLI